MTAPAAIPSPIVDFSFPHPWRAEILTARPIILPARHFVYPRQAEEVERGALEVLVYPCARKQVAEKSADLEGHGFSRAAGTPISEPALAAEGMQVADPTFPQGLKPSISSNSSGGTAKAVPFQGKSDDVQPFLATCALGFRDPAVPSGIWSAPNPSEICAVSGGYAYLIDTTAPERFTMLPFRPVLEVRSLVTEGLLLFVGHHSIQAWGCDGQAWKSEKLSSEGVTISSIDGSVLHGLGWDLFTDKETPFALDLRTGLRISI